MEPMAETTAKAVYSEDEVAAAIANVLSFKWPLEGGPQENIIRGLLMFLPDPPEPKAAEEAARMIVLVDGQS